MKKHKIFQDLYHYLTTRPISEYSLPMTESHASCVNPLAINLTLAKNRRNSSNFYQTYTTSSYGRPPYEDNYNRKTSRTLPHRHRHPRYSHIHSYSNKPQYYIYILSNNGRNHRRLSDQLSNLRLQTKLKNPRTIALYLMNYIKGLSLTPHR
ncbi:unnamed protein product [Aphis gossypii]|uniref:Uncharacterized protein n=1 Tax=Aphis gossypii TaxID=80765 RepID=A0A9P0NIX9_APHGO|nr:unnamed protein product [Aphis gossypii]